MLSIAKIKELMEDTKMSDDEAREIRETLYGWLSWLLIAGKTNKERLMPKVDKLLV